MTAIAQAINESFGHAQGVDSPYSQVAYRSVYYSCIILAVIGLALSTFAIRVPESLAGTYWAGRKKKEHQDAENGQIKDSEAPKTEERELDDLPEDEAEDLPITYVDFSRPRPVLKSHSSKSRRTRRSIHSWDIHTISWLDIEQEQDEHLESADPQRRWTRG